jgi:sigma-B regulation protein RsbU (phosphoserine phosphatase)
MIAMIAGPALAIYIVILGITAVRQYQQSKREVEQAMTRSAAGYSARLDGDLREAARIAETMARYLASDVKISDETIYKLLEDNVTQSTSVYGSCLAFEPGTRRPAPELFAPYVCRDKGGLRRMNIDQSVYDWYRNPEYKWYTQPKQKGTGVWSEPYFDKGAGNILMSTYSAPFKRGNSFGGVCTVDLDLPRLRETVARELEGDLDFVILESNGRYVFHPDASRIMSRTAFEYLEESGQSDVVPIVRQMIAAPTGAAWIDGWDSPGALGVFSARIPSTGWTFIARVPTSRVLADVRRRTIENGAALIAALMLICGAIYWVAGRIAAPITALEHGVSDVRRGDLDARIDESASTVEIRNLASGFNLMTKELRTNLNRLAEEHAARERIEHDLDIARRIQQGLLPTVKPDLVDYDIAGWSRPANKTGGDYYDWQFLSDGRILVSLADVSGHGIGPALVAAVCRAYARASVAANDRELGRIVDRMNDLLVADMPDGRFITFAGVLIDPQKHRVQMISAGHGPLFRCLRKGGELIESGADGLPLGLMADHQYGPGAEFTLDPGDAVLLVTDGLFEGTNSAGNCFGLERLRAAIRQVVTSSADEIIQGLSSRAREFVGDVQQADDISIVVVRRRD